MAVLLAAVLAVGLLPGTAQAADTSGICGDGVTWSYADGVPAIAPAVDYAAPVPGAAFLHFFSLRLQDDMI